MNIEIGNPSSIRGGLACAAVLGLALAALVAPARAGFLPDGRIDYGLEGLPIPPARSHNATRERTVQLLADAIGRSRTLAEAVCHTREIACCQLPASISPLKKGLKDSRPQVKAEAAAGFVMLAGTQFVELRLRETLAADNELLASLQSLLGDGDANVRAAALNALVAIAGKAHPALERALAKPEDAEVFRSALVLASQPAHAKSIAAVWNKLDPRMQLLAAEAVGHCQDASQASLVLPLLKAGVPEKVAALHALAGLKAAGERSAVEAALGDAAASVRREAILALPAVADANVCRAASLRMLGDADPTVRQAAVTILGDITTPAVLEPVASQLNDEYPPLYDAAKALLATQKDLAVRQAAVELAAHLLESENPRRQEDGSYILGAYRSDAALDKHIAIVAASAAGKPDWRLIGQAADSLGRIGRPEAKAALARLCHEARAAYNSSDVAFRSAVCRALIASAKLGDASILPDCLVGTGGSALNAPSDLRAASAFGIGMIGPVSAGSLSKIISGELESIDAKVEAVKAIGNLRSKTQLKAIGDADMLNMDMRWLAHWGRDRITGEHAPFVPESPAWEADVSIIDTTSGH